MKLAFIGLGNMGLPMVRNILRAGYAVTVYNRSPGRCDELKSERTVIAESAAIAVAGADIAITMLADDPAVESVVLGSGDAADEGGHGVIAGLNRGAVHLSMSTISPSLSRKLADAHRRAGQDYVSAPVFGRPEAAAAAKLWIVAAGSTESLARCQPLFQVLGQGAFVVGTDPWQANIVKLGGNFLIASMLEALGEAFALMKKAGVSPGQFLEVVNGSLFKSPLYENYGRIVVEEHFEPAGFQLRLGLKDARLVLGAADGLAVPMPLASLIHDHLLAALARGMGQRDWSAFTQVLAENAGLESQSP
ncbi:MAG TPA: NAD(P)-dependent oxidoreductase [Terriglobia bacterium]|nr:NAD(P)-dependent oxidoreductase [Terriglobia bacterium]